jgi:hypothetical protein
MTAGVQAFSRLACASVLRCTSRVVPQIGLCAVVVDVVVVVVAGALLCRVPHALYTAQPVSDVQYKITMHQQYRQCTEVQCTNSYASYVTKIAFVSPVVA